MQVAHDIGDAYPVIAGHEFITRDAMDEYETLKAGASISNYAFESRSEPADAPTRVSASG